ncbi:MAG: transposase [Candidatus Zhuqueibacterota bacterium]
MLIKTILYFCLKFNSTTTVGKRKSHLTEDFKINQSRWAKYLLWNQGDEIFHVHRYHMFEAVKSVVEYSVQHHNLDNITAIGIDEIQYHLSHINLTLVYQLDAHSRLLLYISKDRTANSLLRFFNQVGPVCSSTLKAVKSVLFRDAFQRF